MSTTEQVPTSAPIVVNIPDHPEAVAADKAAEDFIKQFSQEFDQFSELDDDDVQLPAAGDPEDPAMLAPEEKPVAPPAPVEPVAPKQDVNLVELVARERAAAEATAALSTVTRERDQYRTELEQLRAGKQDIEVLKRRLATNPYAALKELGLDPDNAVMVMTAEKLGDKAPPDLKRALYDAKTQRELQELRDNQAQRDQQEAVRSFWNTVEGAGSAYLQDVPADVAKEAPLVAKLVKKNPRLAEQEVIGEIRRDATERLAKGESPNAPMLTFAEAMKRVNNRYKIWAELGGEGLPPAAAPPAVPAASAATKPAIPSAPSPKPTRPALKPWQKKDVVDLEDAGVRAGLEAAREIERARAAQ